MFVVHGHSLQDAAAAAANTTQLEEFTREMDEEIYYYYFCVWPKAVFIFVHTPYFHWECFIHNTPNWHLTVSTLLAA